MRIFTRVKEGLAKTRKALTEQFNRLITGKKIDDEVLERLEEILIMADVGVKATDKLIRQLSKMVGKNEIKDSEQLKECLKQEVLKFLKVEAPPFDTSKARPFVIMVVGVNGTGKTTAIGKMAKWFKDQGKQSILAAADTFRAAAIEQLEIWGKRAGVVDVIKSQPGADPSAVAFDAVSTAKARGIDIVIIDTAGRLHTKVNLMEELKKTKRVIGKVMPGAPHEILLVLDATTGQNAIAQTKMFNEALGVTGLILTKLDGTAKGGIVIGICHEFNIPIRFLGVGEKITDLRPFDAKEFAEALF